MHKSPLQFFHGIHSERTVRVEKAKPHQAIEIKFNQEPGLIQFPQEKIT